MKRRSPFLIFISLSFVLGCFNAQGQDYEKIRIDTTFDYTNYFNKIVPAMGKAVQTLNSLGFNVYMISFKNEVSTKDKYDEIAEIRFTQNEFNFGNDFFKKCLLIHFKRREYYEDFTKNQVSNWKDFCAIMPQDGNVMLVAIMMDDSLETKQYIKNFLTRYNDQREDLPAIFFNPLSILDFVYQTTMSELRINSKSIFYPTLQRIYFLSKPEYPANDTISRANSNNTECIEINGRTSNGFHFELCIYNSNCKFIIPINSYPNKNKETEILDEEIIKFWDSTYTRLKVKTTIQPEHTLLGFDGVHYSPAVYRYDYISIIKKGGFSFQITNNFPSLNNMASEIPYYQSEIESIFKLVFDYLDKKN